MKLPARNGRGIFPKQFCAVMLVLTAAGPVSAQTAEEERPISLKKLVPNIIDDQKPIWLFPAHLAMGHDLLPAALVLGTTAGLIVADPSEARYFRNSSSYRGFNRVFTGNATAVGIALAPISVYAVGLFTHDTKMKNTALLAGEAVADAGILSEVMKTATERVRPTDIPPHGNFADTWTERGVSSNTSFPSGHAILGFAIATVIARRYSNHRWLPYVAYGLTAAVCFSRLSSSAHYGSDVFIGAALGYSIGRFVVLRQ
ncbi:MAG: phosphatase PAP2 family protein [Bryobacteraceae bacterium]